MSQNIIFTVPHFRMKIEGNFGIFNLLSLRAIPQPLSLSPYYPRVGGRERREGRGQSRGEEGAAQRGSGNGGRRTANIRQASHPGCVNQVNNVALITISL